MITNNFLRETAKAIAGDSFVVPNYYAFSTSISGVSASDTVLPGEAFSRIEADTVRSDTQVTFTATKTGALASTAGDSIFGFGLFSASAAGTLMTENIVPTFLHSTSFDVEFITAITVNRQ